MSYPATSLPVTSGLQLWWDSADPAGALTWSERSSFAESWRLGNLDGVDTRDPAFVTGPPDFLDFDGINDITMSRSNVYFHSSIRGDPHVYGKAVDTDGLFSIFFVVKPTSGQSNTYLFNTGSSNFCAIIYSFVGDDFEFFIAPAGYTGDDPRASSQIVATEDAWASYCYTVGSDGAGKQTGWKEGQSEFSLNKTFFTNEWGPAAEELYVGSAGVAAAHFEGGIGHVLAFNRVLSEAEIVNLHEYFADYYGLTVLRPVPTNLVATAIGANQIDLDWDDVAGVDDYKVYRESPIGGGFALVQTISGPAPDSDWSDTTVLESTQYNYRVTAINSFGESDPSNEDDATTPATPVVPSGGKLTSIRRAKSRVTATRG